LIKLKKNLQDIIATSLIITNIISMNFLNKVLRGVHEEIQLTKTMWITGGICLTLGMTLALGYALRHFIVIDWLNIPNMQAVHGSLNALGFGTLMILGWRFKK
jgi:YndJ-like protein